MHLFKNKKKDVKQFLQEMKANKTNRSSNLNSLQKSNKSRASSSNSYQDNSFGNLNQPKIQSRRTSMNSVDSRESIKCINNSIASNNMRLNPVANKPYQSPPQPSNQRPIYDQHQFRNQSNRLITTQSNQIPHNYVNPAPQPFIYENNHSSPYYSNQRNFNSFDDSRNFHNQTYQNISQPMRSHNFTNTPDFYSIGHNHRIPQGYSQNSNTTVYEKPEQYQNYQEFNTNHRKHQQSNNMTQSNHRMVKNHNQSDHHKMNFNNSQQLSNNRFNQNRVFSSQVSISSTQVTNFDYEMQQISEAEPGLSTEKDTPAKISEFFSKSKNSNILSKQTPIKKVIQSNIFEIFQDDLNTILSRQKVQQLQSNEKVSNLKNLKKETQKLEMKSFHVQTENQEKTKKLQVSQSQKKKLNKNFHQIHDTYMEIDKLFKETSILFNNIQRTSEQFNKKIRSNNNYLKYLSPNQKNQNPKMQFEQTSKFDHTLKKKNHQDKKNNAQNHKTFKKDNPIKQLQI